MKSPFREKIIIFPEDPILGTGGALRNAVAILKNAPFITHNADILSDIDLSALMDYHARSGNLVTLAVHYHPHYNNVWVDKDGALVHIGRQAPKGMPCHCVAFMGIAAYAPAFLDFIPEGPSSVTDAWLRAMSHGRVAVLELSGCHWTDIGTPGAYAAAVFDALRKNGETLFVHESSACGEALLGANVVIDEEVQVSGKVSLRNCLLLPGTRVEGPQPIHNAIVGPGYLLPLDEPLVLPKAMPSFLLSDILGDAHDFRITMIGTGGSDRTYYRISGDKGNAVLMECPATDPDYHRHLLYTKFFRKNSFPVPELLASDDEAAINPAPGNRGVRHAVFEYLGDCSLYSWLHCRRPEERTEAVYRRVMDLLAHLHTSVTAQAGDCLLLKTRVFDYHHLRWETNYFMERFVSGAEGPEIAGMEALEHDFHCLAALVDSFDKTIVHRDFQSQNIMITEGDSPRVIDYQGARMGPPAYDVASILWDPYVSLDASLRQRLLEYYLEQSLRFSPSFDPETFLATVLPCRLQRHMQALGAYVFLSTVKGKAYFRKFIPRCLDYLREETYLAREEYPALYNLVRTLC